MGYWSSLRRTTGTFPSVVSPCTSFFTFLLQYITSLPTIIAQTFSFLYYNFLSRTSGQLTLCGHALHNLRGNNSDTGFSASKQPTDFLQLLPPYFHLIWIDRTEKLKPSISGTLVFCHTSYHTPRGTNWTQSAIEQFLTAKALPFYPEQVPRNEGQTDAGSSTNTRAQSAARLKRKASSASIGTSKAQKASDRRTNKKKDDNPNPRDPNNRDNLDDHTEAEPGKYFACHFFKLNPHRYHRCLHKQLKTLDNLKQHIKRNHYSTVLHCRGCWDEFGYDQLALRNHGRQDCRQKQGPDILYAEDERLLNTERGSSARDKWYQIWGQICEGHQEPDSPYVELNLIDELDDVFRLEYQARFRAHISSLRAASQNLVNPTIDDIFDRVDTVGDGVFSRPTLSEARYPPRRIFRPINAVESQVGDESSSGNGSQDAQPAHQDDAAAEGAAEGLQSPSVFLPALNNPDEEDQSFEEMLGPLLDDDWVHGEQ